MNQSAEKNILYAFVIAQRVFQKCDAMYLAHTISFDRIH